MIAQALLLLGLFVQAATGAPATEYDTSLVPYKNYASQSVGVSLTAGSSLVVDRNTGTVLWEENATQQRPVASIVKLITALVLLEDNLDFTKAVTVTKADQRAEGGNRQIYLGETLLVRDLFHSMLIASDNEAVMALVRSSGYSQDEFVEKVQSWLSDHGFNQTVVTDPTGLSAGTVSTAQEIARIAEMAFSNDFIAGIAQKPVYRFETMNTGRLVRLDSTNMLLGSDFGIQVGKTGFIDEAGYCLTTVSQLDNGTEVVTVVLGATSLQNRFQDTKAMLYWIQQAFIWR